MMALLIGMVLFVLRRTGARVRRAGKPSRLGCADDVVVVVVLGAAAYVRAEQRVDVGGAVAQAQALIAEREHDVRVAIAANYAHQMRAWFPKAPPGVFGQHDPAGAVCSAVSDGGERCVAEGPHAIHHTAPDADGMVTGWGQPATSLYLVTGGDA